MGSMKYSELKEILDKCSHEEFLNIKSEYEFDERKNVKSLFTSVQRKFDNQEKLVKEYNARKQYENMLLSKGIKYIAGIDEVGRGPLAGPVYTAAVILDLSKDILEIKDSKKLSHKKREELSKSIIESCISYSIGIADEKEIDSINILNATKLAMKRAIEGLKVRPEHLLIDALKLDEVYIPQIPIIKGDDKSISIGAASIVAKVARDNYMDSIAQEYPEYLFDKNKGYGTEDHIKAIKKYGICDIHRRSFVTNFI